MTRNDDERDFRLRPSKPRSRGSGVRWSDGFRILMYHARNSSAPRRTASPGPARRSYQHRCAVRVTYSKNATRGHWRAHGRYLARDSATLADTKEDVMKEAGFNTERERVDVASELERWQSSHDPLLWKIIVSPEFGERADLQKLTRDLVKEMEIDLGTPLEWVAVAHHNTGHPHVHIAIRGVRSNGEKLQLNRDFIQHGIRSLAEDLCSRQLGYRTQLDAQEAERREVTEHRFTLLDRSITRAARGTDPDHFVFQRSPHAPQPHAQHTVGRLRFLESMGLATMSGPDTWQVQRDFESVLRAIQRANDRQRTLADHGLLPSDPRLPIRSLDWEDHPNGVQGRILVHGQDESSGRGYLMLEGTDAIIHFVPYVPLIENVRSFGGLRVNSFVKLRRVPIADGRVHHEIQSFGNADTLLSLQNHFSAEARRLRKDGIISSEDGWGGWFGKYQAKLSETAMQLINVPSQERERDRARDNSLGR